MKKNVIATATFTALAALAAPSAFAQSSVTLYGVLDEGIDYTNNAGRGAVWKWRAAMRKAAAGA
jgi:predicted porin